MLVYNLDNFISDTTDTSDTTSLYNSNILIYYINSINVNNRYFHQNEIPSNIIGFVSDIDIYIKNILFLCKYTKSDTTIFLYNNDDLIFEFVILEGTTQKQFNDLNIILNNNKQLKIFIKSDKGVNYPVLKIILN